MYTITNARTSGDVEARGEQRFVSVGTDSAGRILVVVCTHRGGTAKLLIGLKVSRETGSMTATFGVAAKRNATQEYKWGLDRTVILLYY